MLSSLVKLGGYLLLAREAADFVATTQYQREREIQRKNAVCTATGSLIGMAVGMGIGILVAPRSGKDTREIIAAAANEKIQSLQGELSERKKALDEAISRKKEEFCEDEEERVGDAAE